MKTIHVLFLSFFLVVACQNESPDSDNGKEEIPKPEFSPNSARNSVNWPGTYLGIIPCADCPGIKMEVVLDRTEQFIIRTKYTGKDGAQYKNKGQVQWGPNGNIIKLNGLGDDSSSFQFAVEKDQLVKLDVSGKRIEGDLKDHYVLKKTDETIYDKYFRLITLNGKPVIRDKTKSKQPHIILQYKGSANGFAGCNHFNGEYDKEGTSLSFKRMASTKMMCPEMKVEDPFLAGLQKTSGYSISAGILTFKDKEGKELMAFKHDFFGRPVGDEN